MKGDTCLSRKEKKFYFDYQKVMKDLRIDSDLTQTQVASILGISQTMYARYERGATEFPIRHLLKLCEYYNVPSDYFLGLDSEKKNHSD